MSENEKLGLSEFENLDVNELNEILVSDDSRRADYLDYLRHDGWFAGSWATGACVVLPDGRLIPVGDGHHDATARHALDVLGVDKQFGEPIQKLFVESGGIVVGANDDFASITGNAYSGNERNYRIAAKYISTLKNPPPEIMISTSDVMKDINTADFISAGYQL